MQEALTGIDAVADEVIITSLQSDLDERETITAFMNLGCGCRLVNKKACSEQFSLEYVASFRASCVELSRGELDLAIMGYLVAGMNTSSTVSTVSRHKNLFSPRQTSLLKDVQLSPWHW